jgi:transcriptional/translational regulatory protein YebC/TACO1
MFDRKGQIYLEAAGRDEDAAMEAALEAGAEDFARAGDQFVVTTDPAQMHAVKDALEAAGLPAAEGSIEWIPKNTVRVEGKEAESLVKLLEALEDLDDVQKVEGNFDIPEDAMAGA